MNADNEINNAVDHYPRTLVAIFFPDAFKVAQGFGMEALESIMDVAKQRIESLINAIDECHLMGRFKDGYGFYLGFDEHQSQKDLVPFMDSIAKLLREPINYEVVFKVITPDKAETLCDQNAHPFILRAFMGAILRCDETSADQQWMQTRLAAEWAAREKEDSGVIVDGEQNTARSDAAQSEQAVLRAMSEGALRLYFQPQICMQTGLIIGAEALLRCDGGHLHQEGLPHSIAQVFEIAQEIGIEDELNQLCWQQAIRMVELLQRMTGLPPGFRMGLNMPVSFFLNQEEWAEDAIRNCTRPESLKVELTEIGRYHENHAKQIRRVIATMHGLGCEISMDDFGEGYSNMGRLLDIAVDEVKLDKSVVHSIGQGGQREQMLESVVSLLKKQRIRVVAEGVETSDHYEHLRQIGCDLAQGYLFAPALAEDQFVQMIMNTQTLRSVGGL